MPVKCCVTSCKLQTDDLDVSSVSFHKTLFAENAPSSCICMLKDETRIIICLEKTGKDHDELDVHKMASGNNTYKLIEFIDEEKAIKSVDFVPATWIHYDTELNNICTRFMPPPYDKKNIAILHGMIKSKISPPNEWPKFIIDIKGEARSYDEAVRKLKVLETENYAFSTDCEEHAKARALAEKQTLKKKKINHDKTEMRDLMKVPSLIDSEEDSSPYESNRICESSSDSDAIPKRTSKQLKAHTKDRTKQQVIDNCSDTGMLIDNNKNSVHSQKKYTKTSQETSTKETKQIPGKSSDLISKEPTVLSKVVVCTASSSHGSNNSSNKILSPKNLSQPTQKPAVKSKKDDEKTDVEKCFRSISIQQSTVLSQVQELKIAIENLQEKIEELCVSNVVQQDNAQQNQQVSLAESLNLEFPIKNMDDFTKLDTGLNTQNFKQQLMKDMSSSIDPRVSVSRNIANVMKKFLSRDVVQQFTAVKKTDKKVVCKSTIFCSCMQEIVTKAYARDPKKSPINDRKFFEGLGFAINSSKDWEGHRLLRKKKDKAADVDK